MKRNFLCSCLMTILNLGFVSFFFLGNFGVVASVFAQEKEAFGVGKSEEKTLIAGAQSGSGTQDLNGNSKIKTEDLSSESGNDVSDEISTDSAEIQKMDENSTSENGESPSKPEKVILDSKTTEEVVEEVPVAVEKALKEVNLGGLGGKVESGPETTASGASAIGENKEAIALVYKGKGASRGCPESLARLLQRAGLKTRFVGPEDLRRDSTFVGAVLYAQPGGDEVMLVRDAVGAAQWPSVVQRIRNFVNNGGCYFGICLGGFLAGPWLDDEKTIRALGLVSGDVSSFIRTPHYNKNQVIQVQWLVPEQKRFVYFQAGPFFKRQGTVYGQYSDGSIAALLTNFGKGKVAVSGIHFEAESDWYIDDHLNDPDGLDLDLGVQMINDSLK
ncbi:MAG: hypothetical protein HQM08_01320 [Candidatus Riflebacteria bacterium]|nr:hypothetical protein [Candidatus Riflebacteria bacterium]